MKRPVLEPAAAEFAAATATRPFLFEIAPEEGRKAVDEVQSGSVDQPEIDEQWVELDGFQVRVVKPAGLEGNSP